MPELEFPLIVKPKNEAVSFGIRIVNTEDELREAADVIFREFEQPVLAERYIAGREINVGLLGNNPTEALPPAEIVFGEGGLQIYTWEDKTRRSGREIRVLCPAPVDNALAAKAQDVAVRAFHVLGCHDCARVDMRVDGHGKLYILEVNSLPSLGEHGSYVQGAAAVGLDFTALVNRLVDVAAGRYFGVASPPELTARPAAVSEKLAAFLTSQRDEMEEQTHRWCQIRSRSGDPVGIQTAVRQLDEDLGKTGLKRIEDLSDDRVVWTWQTPAGLDGGTLLIGHLDVPFEGGEFSPVFRREPEWLYGEGIGASRAPLVSMEFALRALRRIRRLRQTPLGVLYYSDEGRDCRYSRKVIQEAAGRAKRVLVLRPGNLGDFIVTARRGQRRLQVTFEGDPLRLGQSTRKPRVLPLLLDKLQSCAKLTSKGDRIAVAVLDLKTIHMPMLLPHQVTATLLLSYPDERAGDNVERQLHDILDHKGIRWKLERLSTRPPMKERRATARLAKTLGDVASRWDIPLKRESSVWPSVAGLVPAATAVVCGVGPVARDLYTPAESVDRISLIQRTLLLAEFLYEKGQQ
jgi:D-alanine-D-alanine ligase